jgi:alanyl-tRNA synthetase
VRRIEAVTGDNAVSYTLEAEARLDRIAGLVRANAGEIEPKLKQVVERSRALEKEIQDLKAKLAGASGRDIAAGAQDIGGAKLIVEIIEGADMNALRATCDSLKDRFERAVVVLATVEDDKVRLIAGVTKAMTATVHAGDLINHVARQVGGKGGGRPDMAQAGGTDASRLEEAMRSVTPWVTERAAKNP